ncbi:DUF4012 domain-containing protein [Patescibacteria group bacterium]|nr:DUF4012 domain-containing protein [Patescibacteria group bacterium]
MGDAKRYYHIKRKSRAASGSGFKVARPQIIWHQDWTANPGNSTAERVLDLEFKATPQPKIWIGLLRWALLVITALLIYALGSALQINGEYLKSSITRRGEAAAGQLQKGAESLKQLDLEGAIRNFRLADKNFTVGLNEFEDLGQQHLLMAGLSFPRSELLQGQEVLLSGQYLARAGTNVTTAMLPLTQYWQNLGKDGNVAQDVGYQVGKLLLSNSKLIDQAVADVESATDILNRISVAGLEPKYAQLISQAATDTQKFKQGVELASVVAQRLPDALGFNHPRYYLLLNQNPNEIRPTGGFIGSYVLVELYQGKLESVFVDTTQRLDGQNMRSDIELPAPLQAVTYYYGMRDANWEPNLPTAARTIQRLYEQAGGGTVDGMITVNPGVITDILKVVGAIYVPEFGINLDADNFVDKVQKHIEIDAQGSYNPKQLLVDFAPLFMDRLFNANEKQLSEVGQALLQRMVSKDVMLYLTDSQLEGVLHTAGFSGEIWETGPADDYLYVVESNLGGNKSSESLTREFALSTTISNNGAVVDSLQLTYQHNGSNKFPDGTNKNYIRIYLPAGTRVTKLAGYNQDTQIDTSVSDGKTVVGFWLTTEPGDSSTVELDYVLPFRLDVSANQPQYRLLVQKQPGLADTNFISRVNLSDELSFQTQGSDRYITWFSGDFEQDLVLTKQLYRQ